MWILDDLSNAAKRIAKDPNVQKAGKITGKVLKKGIQLTGKAAEVTARGAVTVLTNMAANMPEMMEKRSQQLDAQARNCERYMQRVCDDYDRNPTAENYERMCRAYDEGMKIQRNQQNLNEAMDRYYGRNDDDDYRY